LESEIWFAKRRLGFQPVHWKAYALSFAGIVSEIAWMVLTAATGFLSQHPVVTVSVMFALGAVIWVIASRHAQR